MTMKTTTKVAELLLYLLRPGMIILLSDYVFNVGLLVFLGLRLDPRVSPLDRIIRLEDSSRILFMNLSSFPSGV